MEADRKVKLIHRKINFSPPKMFLITKKQFAGQILAKPSIRHWGFENLPVSDKIISFYVFGLLKRNIKAQIKKSVELANQLLRCQG